MQDADADSDGDPAAGSDPGPDPTLEPDDALPPRWRVLMSWPVLTLLFLVPCLVWALASPLFSAPDEPAHVVKATGLWYGQLVGPETDVDGYPANTYRLPSVWKNAFTVPDCYKFLRNVTADCAPPLAGDATITDVNVPVGHYPPGYFALVGWGGRFFGSAKGVFLMRGVSALVAAALLALAVRALSRVVRPALALTGVLLAATPMTYFLAGSVNPSGLEITSAIAVWSHAIAIFSYRSRRAGAIPRALLVGMTASGAIMIMTRQFSALFVAAIVVFAALSVPVPSVIAALRDRRTWLVGAALAFVTAVAAAFILRTGDPGSLVPGKPPTDGTGPVQAVIGESDSYVRELVGVFGWLDTRSPQLSFYLWLGLVFAFVMAALTTNQWRRGIGLAGTFAMTMLLPFIQLRSIDTQGLVWQGRYTLPIAVGMPVLAVVLIDPLASRIPGFLRRCTVLVTAMLGVANVYALYWALRRYVVGGDRGTNIFVGGAWQPPLGSAALVGLMVAFGLATMALVVVATRSGEVEVQGRSA